jgi:protein phosphatase 1 regulatory subunit 42
MNLTMLEVGANLSNINTRRKNEPREHYLARSVHILLSGKSLTRIENLAFCKNITRLYLYDNSLKTIEGLGECTGLVQLYLQNNQIQNIKGLEALCDLKVLHLGHNKLRVIECECFVGLLRLETLHLEHQNINCEELTLEPGCFLGLESLTTLTISENRLKGIDRLATIPDLQTLNLASCGITIDQWPVSYLH